MSPTMSPGFWDTCGALLWHLWGVGKPAVWSTGWAVHLQPVISGAQKVPAFLLNLKTLQRPCPEALAISSLVTLFSGPDQWSWGGPGPALSLGLC